MSKLYDLLYAMIEKLNSSVKTTAQTLTEAEKTQARANIGAMASTFAPTAESVGADPKGTAAAAVSAHNTNTAAHADIRSLISGLTDRLNALANSDDTTLDQMKEVVDYIKDNRELIESVTTNKVNVADIVDNLTTSDSKKPLSAKQGVELLKLISSSSGSGGGSGVNLDSAEVGQLIVVEAVDSEGQPIKWKAVDRTHYKETIGEDVAVLAETSVAFTNSTATVAGFVAGAIKEGNTYKVSWNDTEYTCKAYLSDGIVHLGNGSLAGAPVTTAEPFCIVGAGITCMVFKDTENTETITLKVNGVAEVVYHKLDGRFLPEGSPYTESSSVEVPLHIEFDGNVSGKETAIVEGVTFVKVSNTVLTKDDLVGATVVVCAGGEEISIVLNAEDGSMQDLSADGIPFIANFEAFIAVQSDYTFEGSEFTAGLYFVSVEGVYTKSLSNPNVTVTEETETVHKLDPKYLPDGVPYCIDGGMVELLPETTVTLEEEGFGVCGAISVPVGTTCIVNWNGTEYECVVQDSSGLAGAGAIFIGNGAMWGMSGNGEPFGIAYVPAEGISMVAALDGTESTDITLSIYQGGAEIRKLDNRCLDLEWLPVMNQSKVEILAETTKDTSFGYDVIWGAKGIEIVAGKKYAVLWNGVEYEVIAQSVDGENVLLENVVFQIQKSYDAYAAGESDMYFIMIVPKDGSTQVTLSIYEIEAVPNKLPEEFLPESVGSVILRSSTEGSTKLFKLTVDDSGNITATEVT